MANTMLDQPCPGCGCMPGEGVTKGCTDPEGCGFFASCEREMLYESKEHNGDAYDLCNTLAAFNAWLRDYDWQDEEDFEQATGVTFEEIRGQWFNVTHNRVSTL